MNWKGARTRTIQKTQRSRTDQTHVHLTETFNVVFKNAQLLKCISNTKQSQNLCSRLDWYIWPVKSVQKNFVTFWTPDECTRPCTHVRTHAPRHKRGKFLTSPLHLWRTASWGPAELSTSHFSPLQPVPPPDSLTKKQPNLIFNGNTSNPQGWVIWLN